MNEFMTEDQWLASAEPENMLALIRGNARNRLLRFLRFIFGSTFRATDRRLLLFAHAFCERLAKAIETASFCQTQATNIRSGALDIAEWAVKQAEEKSTDEVAMRIQFAVQQSFSHLRATHVPLEPLKRMSADLLRDIFGNPFDIVRMPKSVRVAKVVNLASAILDQESFYLMPRLADALEEAGCRNESVLEHCRQLSEHVRGCWVLDLILGHR
jgi:hypothetical protein